MPYDITWPGRGSRSTGAQDMCCNPSTYNSSCRSVKLGRRDRPGIRHVDAEEESRRSFAYIIVNEVKLLDTQDM